ncbi:hypothetical protein BGX27_001765, partial [Mortierella sp. AM989]
AVRHPSFLALFDRFYHNIRRFSFPISHNTFPRPDTKCLLDLQFLKSLQLTFKGFEPNSEEYRSPHQLPLDLIAAKKLLKYNASSLTSVTIHAIPQYLSKRILYLVSQIDTLESFSLRDWSDPDEESLALETLDPEDFEAPEYHGMIYDTSSGDSKGISSNSVTHLSVEHSIIDLGIVLNLCVCLPSLKRLSLVGVEIKDGCDTNPTDDEDDL